MRLEPEEFLLSFEEDKGEGVYMFQCSDCRAIMDKPADKRIAYLLLVAAVMPVAAC